MPTRREELENMWSTCQGLSGLCSVGVQLEMMGACIDRALHDITDALPDIGHTEEVKRLNMAGIPREQQELLAETFRIGAEKLGTMLKLIERFGFEPDNNLLMIAPKQEEG